MATVSGQIIFDRNRSATIDAGDSGIANVPVVLQNITTGVRLVVLTDAAGNYAFINVPNGSYRIVEAFGTAGGVPTPGNFALAVAGPVPTAATPPISFVANPPAGSTNLDCLTPNTILITVTGADITNQNILNGPVIYTPITTILDPCTTVSNTNLITDADNGTFGFFPPGTPANTGPAVAPYPNVTPAFTYVVPDPTKFTPIDGEYTIQNLMTDAMSNVIGAWWRIADHTTGNETGRMMVVNGFNPGAVFFRSTVPVTPNTNFLFSTWILNLFKVTGFPPAQLGVRILDQNGNVLFQQALGVEIPVNINAPEWKQIGTVINSMNNTQITVEFFSEGEAVVGNDYAIDDVALQEILVPIFTPVKSSSTFTANVGDIVTYTVKLTNTCTSPLINVFFRDNVPDGLLFIPGSVTVNGVPELGVDPNIGFPLPDIPGGSVTEVTFQVRVEGIPNPNPAINTATIDYSYTPVEGGIPGNFTEESNPVPLMVEELPGEADIAVVKQSDNQTAVPGQLFTYTIIVSNFGPADAESVLLTDSIPTNILNPQFSIDDGVTFHPWIGSLNLGTIEAGGVRIVLIRGTVSPTATGVITNTATVSSPTPDPNPENNTSTLETPVAVVEADVAVVKQSNQVIAVPGEPFSYTITVNNFGPSAAENVLLMDSIPSSILNPMYSIDGGVTFNPWPGFLSLGTLPAGAERIIIIKGTVSPDATGVISNTAIVSSTTPDPNPENNTSTLEIPVSAVEADVAVEKQSNQAVAIPGEPFSYTIIVNNFGPNAAENVLLMDSIPSSILNPMYSIDGGVTFNPWPGFLNLGTLPAGAERVIIIRGTVSPDATGVISNTAIVSSTTPDPNPENNTSTLETPVSAVEADIAVEKQSNQAIAIPGESLSYTIVVNNFGPNAAEDVLLMDSIPSSILNPEYSIDGGVTFNPWPGFLNLGTLLAGAERIIIIRGTVSPTAAGIIINTATVSSPTPDPNPENNTSTTETPILAPAQADVSITKTASPNPVAPGEMITFTLVVSNAGPNTAENVIVNDNISASITGPVFSVDGGATFNPWLGSLNIGALPAGESRTIIIRGTVAESASGCINNTAIAISATPDPNLFNNVASICVAVAAAEETEADVSVKKFANKKEACCGELVVFTIVVSNAGPADAHNVVLTDSLANILKKPMFSLDDGFAFQPWPGSVNLGTIPEGTSRVVLIKGCIRQTCSCKIINTAQVSSTTQDPDLNNNTATACIQILKCCDD
ncbi:conserved repeat domain-containing protein [Lacrimispora sphenoides]|uniref:DUF11 domain-containing protein n=1 Tax=Lacrimispora sphenoides TaxID=29370 RepID=UPI0008D323BE|nr:DUF11 domain-containing protein [Lacrimispora sphenoides]SET87202.1 conserved repeat domain-containing protein [Lacrimispora sphenoides]